MTVLKLQQDSKQNTYKLSYYVTPDIDHEALISDMHNILVEQRIQASLIWSIDELAGISLLDVLTAGANKRYAIEFLMRQMDFDLTNTIFAGNSGNDLEVHTSPIHSVLVANASSEVRQEAMQMALNMGQADALYFAQRRFIGMNENYSAGILEGVAHYLPETRAVMDNMI